MHLTEEPIKIEKEDLPIQEIGSELKSGMAKAFFPAEIRRIVHVNRHAIQANVAQKKNYPTCILIDEDGTKYQFHALVLQGPAALKYEASPEVAANVFLVTKAGIEAYLDIEADQFFVQKEPVMEKVGLGTRILQKVFGMVEPVPLLGCLVPHHDSSEIDRKNRSVRKEYTQSYEETVRGLDARNKLFGFEPMEYGSDIQIIGC